MIYMESPLKKYGLVLTLALLLNVYFSSVYGQGYNAIYRVNIYVDGYDGATPIIVNVFSKNYTLLINETYTSNFIELLLNESGEYFVAVIYKRVPYVKPVNIVGEVTSVNFTVYDIIDDDSTISIPVHHMVLSPEGSSIKVMGVVFVRNDGDKVVINGTKLRVYLPKEYMKLNTDVMSCCLEQTEDGFIFNVMANLLPNQTYRVIYSYEIPITSKDYYFEVPVSYYTEFIMVAVKEGYDIENPLNLEYRGQIDVEEGKFEIYEVYNASAGTRIGMTIKGVGSDNIWVLSTLVVGTSGLVIALSLWSAFKRKPSLEELEKEKEELMAEMEAIENRFKSGEIDEEEYLRLRIRYKKKIIRLIKRIDRLRKQKGVEIDESGGDGS